MDRSKLHLKMPKQTMRRKLFLYTFAMAILLLALLATMLILLGRFRTPSGRQKMNSLKKAICRRRSLRERF